MNPDDEDARKASKPSVGPAKSAGTTTIKSLGAHTQLVQTPPVLADVW